ncbi:Ig-like V-type domain-containing protein FAM187A [Prorops nasuta]|uniref:Ig-like V-type domain-containing protein FAM187A n=1 Tax=Prorops nasuta TaxID=863751 RepID=UPI0034CF951D
MDQAGVLWCKLRSRAAPPFYLHVDDGSDGVDIVRPDLAPNAKHAAPSKILSDYELKIFTTWTEWSECSTCDAVGNQIRYGYCTLSALNTVKNTRMKQEFYRRHKRRENALTKIKSEENAKAEMHQALSVFHNELPCKSIFTPARIQLIPDVQERKIEIMIRYCKIECPKNVIFEVRDKNGNILESANNSAGIFSMAQEIPKPAPMAVRITLYYRHDKMIKLICPGNLNSDAPIVWRVGKDSLIPSIIKKQSRGRIYINPQMQIVFNKTRFQDAKIYSCWQNEKLAGTINLHVTGEMEIKCDHHIIMIGAIAIVSVFLIIFWKAFKNRKRFSTY